MNGRNTPRLETMASGNQCIVLKDGVTEATFPARARHWAKYLGLEVTHKIDGPGEHLWECSWEGQSFWLAHDDWLNQLSLEPQNDLAGGLIEAIAAKLLIVQGDDTPASP